MDGEFDTVSRSYLWGPLVIPLIFFFFFGRLYLLFLLRSQALDSNSSTLPPTNQRDNPQSN
jgi:hypothetical protein